MSNRIISPVPGLLLGLSLLLVLAAATILAPAADAAGKVQANLRVVTWQGKIIFDGKVKSGSTRVKPNTECLGGSPGPARTVGGPTALGLLVTAAKQNRALRPLRISDGEFGFGICGIGGNMVKDENWWQLRTNYRDSSTGAELTTLKKNDTILFYLAKSYMETSPDSLVLRAPARVKRGKFARVRVVKFNGAGKASPAKGARVPGAKPTNAKGFTRVKIRKRTRLAARMPGLIPSNRVVVKVRR